MSTSTLSLTKAKELAINFIKKYKNVLRDGETCKPISNKKPEVVTISDTTEVQHEIAFINFGAGKFDHLMNQGGDNFDPMISYADNLNAQNQIDHAINAFKLAKKELDVFINELVKAKAAGAKHVVDTSWCERKDFEFEK